MGTVIVRSGHGTAAVCTKATVAVTMNEATTVSRAPTPGLNDGGAVTYTGGSGTSMPLFSAASAGTELVWGANP
jgi:hypothetical protein